MDNKNFGIYVHIPFCVSKCEYCSFVSVCAVNNDVQKYINFLCKEIELKSGLYKNRKVTSIYFGGGTPSVIDAEHIKRVINIINEKFNVNKQAEISIECNPCSITKEKLEMYKMAGVNRISFGVQSMNDNLLNILGRKHTSAMAENSIKMAKGVGFTNISADLMIGILNQTKEDLIIGAKKLAHIVTHISAYMLMLEEGTPLCQKVKKGELKVANDDECVAMYDALVKELKKLGFNRYEISNFAKQNFECKHNVNYWDMGEYVGFGLASHSFIGGARFSNFERFENYYNAIQILENKLQNEQNVINLLKNSKKIIKNNEKMISNNSFLLNNIYLTYEQLAKQELIEETIMLGLRQQKGVNINVLKKLGYDILNEKKDVLKKLSNQNILEIKNEFIKLNENSFGVCNAVVLELI